VDKDTIAKRLVQLRGNRSKETIAQEVNISIRALESYETGQRIPRDAVKLSLARCYDTTVEAIFFQDEQHEM
jgi:DNA-binding XRE family transcriptional regulator